MSSSPIVPNNARTHSPNPTGFSNLKIKQYNSTNPASSTEAGTDFSALMDIPHVRKDIPSFGFDGIKAIKKY
jgi:hypothetical protein